MTTPEAGDSIDAARRLMTQRLREAGIESAELDARLLIGAALKLDLTGLIVNAPRALSADDCVRLQALLAQRLAGAPVARILGEKEFWGLTFRLDDATLVPRPDTETVVEAVLAAIAELENVSVRIADLGTGTGAILLAILSACPPATGVGTDRSEAALHMARTNAERLGLAARASFVACDYAAALAGGLDVIASNPPYIRSADIDGLDREVRDHDPRLALDGGSDGLDAYRVIASHAADRLRPGGRLIVEIGVGQHNEVAQLMRAAGLVPDVEPRRDLGGIARVVSARK